MKPARISQADMAYSVPRLAVKWQCSESLIRKLVKAGKLHSIPLGALIRIPASEVERFECNTQSSASEVDMPLSGAPMESADAEPFTPPIGRAQRPRLGQFGRTATVHLGPWEGS
jgi:hypothetical protein